MREEPAYGPVELNPEPGRIKKAQKLKAKCKLKAAEVKESDSEAGLDALESSEAYYVRMKADVFWFFFFVLLTCIIARFQFFGEGSRMATPVLEKVATFFWLVVCCLFMFSAVQLVFLFFENWRTAVEREEEEMFQKRK